MFKKHIAFKLTSGFVIIVLISMLTIGIFFIQMFRQYTFETRQKTLLTRAQSIAEVISEYFESSGHFRGFGGFMKFLNIMTEADVWITDSTGNSISMSGMGMGMGMGMNSFNNSTASLPVEAKEVIEEVLSGKESVSQSFSSIYNEATLTVGVPILNSSNNVIGTVLLHAPVTGISETSNKALNILLISIFVSLILAIALGIFYSHLLTRPLKALNRSALEMARGNYSTRIGINRQDELGQLGNSLDLLASKLGYSINQLFQEKGKLSDIISSISEGIVAFDTDLKPVSINTALSEIMNKSIPYQNDSLESDFNSLGIDSLLKKSMEDKKPLQAHKTWHTKKLKFTISPILDSHHNITGAVALVQDISESERLEQLRRDFVANVSHEFRTPLTVIKGSLEALLDGTLDDESDIKRYHKRMLSETQSLERLVGDLLDLSRLQSGKISINKEKVHIPTLLSDAIKSLQTIADKKRIKIEYIQNSQISPILGDYDRLKQLFVIFLDNAIKYSPENTIISIKANIDKMLNVTICDQGYGISAEELPNIWNRFYKADKSRKSTGTGLGLAIAKHLIELHNGKVLFESELDKGSKVSLSFPV